MRVIISTMNRFHVFNLAEELQKRGYLTKLLAGHFNQKTNARGYAINSCLVKHNIIPVIMHHIPLRVHALKRWRLLSQYLAVELYDRWASRHIDYCDIFVGMSGMSLYSLRRAQALGAISIVTRGSAHMLTQTRILEEEFATYGTSHHVTDRRVIARELQEYQEADFIAVASNFVYQSFLEHRTPPGKLIKVTLGVHTKHFPVVPKADQIFRVMHVGGDLRKGTLYLLQAMSELNLPHAELLLIGPVDPEVQPFVDRYRGPIRIQPRVPHTELFRLYAQSSVYVLPSLEDGFARVITEAMTCGLPVITTSNTGSADIIRDGIDGFIIPIRNVSLMKEKLKYLYDNENIRQEMGDNAKQSAMKFTWERYGDTMVQEYERILQLRAGVACS